MFWIFTSVVLAFIAIVTLILNTVKDNQIEQLKMTKFIYLQEYLREKEAREKLESEHRTLKVSAKAVKDHRRKMYNWRY
jgi:hypothetical protein